MIRDREISRSRLRIALAIFSGLFVVLILSGCAAKAVMQPPNATFYILDLSDSGNPDDQFDRINQDVLKSLTRSSLGQPFEIDGVLASGPTVLPQKSAFILLSTVQIARDIAGHK
jgi:hypothetical protein